MIWYIEDNKFMMDRNHKKPYYHPIDALLCIKVYTAMVDGGGMQCVDVNILIRINISIWGVQVQHHTLSSTVQLYCLSSKISI